MGIDCGHVTHGANGWGVVADAAVWTKCYCIASGSLFGMVRWHLNTPDCSKLSSG